jgi:hypothetical protein
MAASTERDETIDVDSLQYDWPPNIVTYDTRYFLGLALPELMVIVGAAVGLMVINLFLAPVGAAVGLLMVKRFEGLGDRRLPEYALAWLIHRLRKPAVTLPHILPVEEARVTILDLDGNLVVSIGDEL